MNNFRGQPHFQQWRTRRQVARVLFFVTMCGNQIGTTHRAVDRHFTFRAAAYGAYFLPLGWTKPPRFSLVANRAKHRFSFEHLDNAAAYALRQKNTKISIRLAGGQCGLAVFVDRAGQRSVNVTGSSRLCNSKTGKIMLRPKQPIEKNTLPISRYFTCHAEKAVVPDLV